MSDFKITSKIHGDLSLNKLFGEQEIEITCPGCEHQFPVKLKETMQDGNTIQCPSCQRSITIQHDDSAKQGLADIEKSLKNFESTLKNFGK